jgi:hypothetical protein
MLALVGFVYGAGQESGYFPKDIYVFPILVYALVLWCLYMLVTSDSFEKTLNRFYERIGKDRRMTAYVIVVLCGALTGGVLAAGGYRLFEDHKKQMLNLSKPESSLPAPQPPAKAQQASPLQAKPELPPQAMRKPEKAQPEARQTQHPSPTSPPAAQSKQKDVDAGLTFREVPPESLGLKRTVPDSFTIEFGTNKGTFPTELLKKQVPFERLIGIKADGDLPLKVYFDKDGDMKIDATIYESRGKVAAVIKSSNFSVINSGWDRNWDPVAFEIVDERQNPVFQIERINWNFLKLRGLLITSAGAVFAITDSALIINPTGQVAPPKRLFQYPGNAHLHQRVGK